MQEWYIKSLQMIKLCKIKNEKEYRKVMKQYLVMSNESLKGRTGTRNFKKIIKLAQNV